MRRLGAVLFWSVVAAAFIGPGTVTTCGAAGAAHGTVLLWALAFSGAACFTLQEAAARAAAVSGVALAEAIRRQPTHPTTRAAAVVLVAGAILVGCAAYEAGNLLGAVTGLRLIVGDAASAWPWWALTGSAAVLLATGTSRSVARAMGAVVGVMGLTFLLTALRLRPDLGAVASGLAAPSVPEGAEWVVLGLVGTTVVPYNLFLGSGLARGQRLAETRFGLGVAIGLGVVISMAVVVVGATLEGPFTFDGMAETLRSRLGPWGVGVFAVGLVAAGFSSAVTAPLAAAVTASGLFGGGADRSWSERGAGFRGVAAAVLVVGLGFGVAGFRPVPLIVAVQALNGVLLPVVAIWLWLVVNDRGRLGTSINGPLANAAFGVVVAVAVVLGTWGTLRAAAAALGTGAPSRTTVATVSIAAILVLSGPVGAGILRARRRDSLSEAPGTDGRHGHRRAPRS